MFDDPLSSSVTAYQSLEEKKYKAEVQLVDRYQNFTAELLRLALLGIGVFGFLYKEVFLNFEPTKSPNINRLVQKFAYKSVTSFEPDRKSEKILGKMLVSTET